MYLGVGSRGIKVKVHSHFNGLYVESWFEHVILEDKEVPNTDLMDFLGWDNQYWRVQLTHVPNPLPASPRFWVHGHTPTA